MRFWETRADLRKELERRLTRPLPMDQWEEIAPEWSPPYDDDDLRELLSSLNNPNEELLHRECNRLGGIISRELEESHRTNPEHERLLNASGWNVRPLGEFWAWSWYYANVGERAVLT